VRLHRPEAAADGGEAHVCFLTGASFYHAAIW
jgi:hypothetical protein